jgi:ligand-binding sensor domain-containing protein
LVRAAFLLFRGRDDRPAVSPGPGTTAADPPVTRTAASALIVEPNDPLDVVRALAPAPDGHLWAATAGGVVRWDLTTREPTVFGDEEGVPAAEVMAVDIAPDGMVWAAGDGWIARYDGVWEVFSRANTPLIDSVIEAMAVDQAGVV